MSQNPSDFLKFFINSLYGVSVEANEAKQLKLNNFHKKYEGWVNTIPEIIELLREAGL